MSYPEVIVGTDGSSTASDAVAAAAAIAAATGASLVVATAWYRHLGDPPTPSEEASYPGGGASGHEAAWATETTSDAAAIARRAGVTEIHQATPQGGAADALVGLGEQHPGALLAVGTAGLSDRAERLVGNVPHALSHHAHNDLLLVARGGRDGGWGSVALATDGSATAASACRRGLALAEALEAKATLLTVARNETAGERALERTRHALGAPDLDGAVVTGADVARCLIEAAAGYDLLVIGNKGMSGPSRLLGSVSNRVTHEVPTDILLVNTTR